MVQDFQKDFEAVLSVLHPSYNGPRIAFSRAGDGEYAILRNMVHEAKSDGWKWIGQVHPLQRLLFDSLVAGGEMDDYYVGISAANHHPRAHAWYVDRLKSHGVPMNRVTFASLFIFDNYDRFRGLDFNRYYIVGQSSDDMNCDLPRTPADPAWPKFCEELAVELASTSHPDPILVSAGPWASVLVHRFWRLTSENRNKRQTIIDVGSAVDEFLQGKKTRRYQHPRSHQRHWVPKFSDPPNIVGQQS